jgi:hypothetical protein
MRFGIFAGVLVAASVVPAAAMAQGKFGGAGQLVISDDQPIGGATTYITPALGAGGAYPVLLPGAQSLFSFEYGSVSDNKGSGTAFGINPAADYFVIPNLSVGGQILLDFFNLAVPDGQQQPSVTIFGFAPRVGYNIPITDMISFWPKLEIEYAEFSVSNGGGYGSSFALGIFAPFIFSPVQHFFLGIGPNLGAQLSNSVDNASAPKAVNFGIAATFGGWFLGD